LPFYFEGAFNLVLPGSWSVALFLIILSVICFGLWPSIFKLTGKWRFELFSFDFAAGSLLFALIAAYTLGTLGSSLDFSDNMLVAGRRAELAAVVTGGVFAFANMLYLSAIALLGLSNGTLLTFGVFGCAVGLLHLQPGSYVATTLGSLLLAVAATFSILAARVTRTDAVPQPGAPKPAARPSRYARSGSQQVKPPIPASTRGAITGILGGIVFAAVAPVLGIAQTSQLGIGAYGGLLLATIGAFIATFFLNFFFLNISLEGGKIRYTSYFKGTAKDHLNGLLGGAVCAGGVLALYTAYTGTAGVTSFDGWLAALCGALVAALSGMLLRRKAPRAPEAKRNTLIAVFLFAVGAAVLLAGLR
jgi:glucose uptake protein